MRRLLFPLFRGAVCLALLCAALAFVPCRAEDIKKIQPIGYVSDFAGAIDSGTKVRLEALCAEVEQKTGAQMAIVTVHSLEGETASQYANELFKQWGIGGKKDDRGVLMLVAPSERKYWTEVGYGLEPVINDARAGDAGRAMVPLFRQGNYGGGIEAAAWMLAKFIADDRGVQLSGRPPIRRQARPNANNVGILAMAIFGLIILASLISFFTGRGGGRFGGGGGSGVGWLIASILLSNLDRGGRGWSGGGFGGSSGWGGGGSDSGGGGDFGGFGGGSSGGGGAGGDW